MSEERPAPSDHPAPESPEAAWLAEAIGPPAAPRLVREQAFGKVKAAIISGRIAPGARLTERALCAALGVSRTIVREVIRGLEAERLVQVTAHRGPRVARLTAKTAREIYDLRAELEVLLVRDFVARAPDADLRRLEALLGEIGRAARAEDVEGLVAIMARFYTTLTAGADNEVATDILETLLARISRLRVLAMAEPGRIARSVGEIAEIVASIGRRDAAAAEDATRAYVYAARDAALRQIALEHDAPPGA
ncbi:MAG TPA: GntR family transcriptional regulator [Thermohalobaculum sp.]|nr:GntR family transcriptional regulator [Thermohalobaculum sp.]